MPTIRVDDEVYATLQRRHTADRTVNHVLRDLLGLTATPRPARAHYVDRTLADLLRAGLLQPGQQLTWRRRQLQQIHTVNVNADGTLLAADGSAYASPNSAATGVAGYPVIGWPLWHTDDGASLDDLRAQLAGAGQPYAAGQVRPAVASAVSPGSRGALAPLLRAGLLTVGQRLTWARPRLGEVHTVTVDERGNLIGDGGVTYRTPNAAANAIAGYPTVGWPVWCTDDGVSVGLLRTRLPAVTSSRDAPGTA
jgi:hypothetical protein